MALSYEFKIALENSSEHLGNSVFREEIFPKMQKAYQELVKKNEWFPKIRKHIDYYYSNGYGEGPQKEHPLDDLLLFTTQFPDYTFYIFYLWFNHKNLAIYRIKGDQLLDEYNKSYEAKYFRNTKYSFDLTSLEIDDDISYGLVG